MNHAVTTLESEAESLPLEHTDSYTMRVFLSRAAGTVKKLSDQRPEPEAMRAAIDAMVTGAIRVSQRWHAAHKEQPPCP